MTTRQIEEQQDSKIQEMAERIITVFNDTFSALIARREAALAAGIEPLDAEAQALRTEYGAIEQAAKALEDLLPAQARIAQADADRLIVAGDKEAAQVKIAEMEKAENAPAAMRQRQEAISLRLTEIDREKQDVARAIFESWYAEAQSVVRAAERGLFVTLLDGLKASFFEYQERTHTEGTIDRPYGFLVKDSYLSSLTAPDRSQEWVSGQRWYRGRQ